MKLLIRNMEDNKKSGWSKSKNLNSELKSKKEVEDEVLRQAREAEELLNQPKY